MMWAGVMEAHMVHISLPNLRYLLLLAYRGLSGLDFAG